MEAEIFYRAKDGRKFTDPYECERYEKRLGKEPGTVGRAKIDLAELGSEKYVFGMLKARHDGQNYYRVFATYCIDDKLENYVNPANLDDDKRWLSNTFADVLRELEAFADDDLCEYEFMYCPTRQFGGADGEPFGVCRTHNPQLWDEMQKAEQQCDSEKR